MSLTVTLSSKVYARMQLWRQRYSVPLAPFVGTLLLDLIEFRPILSDDPDNPGVLSQDLMESRYNLKAYRQKAYRQMESDSENAAEQKQKQNTTSDGTTLTLNFTPEAQAALLARAVPRELTAEEYIATVLEQLVAVADLLDIPDAVVPEGRVPSDEILMDAIREMRANQIRRREQAVRTLTQVNNLKSDMAHEEQLVAEYERKALDAWNSGNHELAIKFYQEYLPHAKLLTTLGGLVTEGMQLAEQVKNRIREEEYRVRVATTHAVLQRQIINTSSTIHELQSIREELDAVQRPLETLDKECAEWIAAKTEAKTEAKEKAKLGT